MKQASLRPGRVDRPAGDDTDDPNASLLAGKRQGSSALFLRGGSKAPIKKVGGPKLRKKDSVFEKEKLKSGLQKAAKRNKAPPGLDDLAPDCPVGYIIVFDIGSTLSFEEAERQLQSKQPAVLVGNKTDKRRALRRVTYEEGLRLSQSMKAEVPYIETSAKLYQKVDQVFLQIVKKLQAGMIGDPKGNRGAPAEAGDDGGNDPMDPVDPVSGDTRRCNLCTKYCKCCPRPCYNCLKKCDNCTIM